VIAKWTALGAREKTEMSHWTTGEVGIGKLVAIATLIGKEGVALEEIEESVVSVKVIAIEDTAPTETSEVILLPAGTSQGTAEEVTAETDLMDRRAMPVGEVIAIIVTSAVLAIILVLGESSRLFKFVALNFDYHYY